jgi:hypothetical protein
MMVNTFVLSSDLKENFRYLDYKRLGKQRVEAKQILNVLEGKLTKSGKELKGYKNHPIVKMWSRHICGLKLYLNYCIEEWVSRGYNNTMQKENIDEEYEKEEDLLPWWVFNKQVQNTHKASLIRKDPDFYYYKFFGTTFETEYIYYGYIWSNKLSVENAWKMYKNEEIEPKLICDLPNIDIPEKFLSILSPLITNGIAVYQLPKQEILDNFNLSLFLSEQREFSVSNPNKYVLGGFGAFGNPSSFHHPEIRKLRKYIYSKIKPEMQKIHKNKYIQLLFDRFSLRQKGATISAETWHRDITPNTKAGDIIYGGWINLDIESNSNQYFSCIPSSYINPYTPQIENTGFSRISIDTTRKTKIEIPPASIIIFNQTTAHEIANTKIKENSYRLYIGWKISDTNDNSLFDYTNIIKDQSIPHLPSHQLPPMYAKLHMVNHKHMITDFSAQIASQYLQENGLVKRFLPSLKETNNLFTEYSSEDKEIFIPTKL